MITRRHTAALHGDGGPPRPGLPAGWLAAGAVVWAAVAGVSAVGWGQADLVLVLLALAPALLVPLGLDLHCTPTVRRQARLAGALGGLAALAVVLPRGLVAAALVGPWLGFAGVLALVGLFDWWRKDHRLAGLIWPAAPVFLAVGAAWLLVDRLGAEVAGFASPIVELTATHFHYAGFASAVLVGLARVWVARAHPVVTGVTVAAVLVGPPTIAVGFAAIPAAQVAGAVILTVGLLALAWVVLRSVVPTVERGAAILLAVSAVAVIIPMMLASHWAVAVNLTGFEALPIPVMARTHGVANALGFTLLGLLGWRRALSRAPAPPPVSSPR